MTKADHDTTILETATDCDAGPTASTRPVAAHPNGVAHAARFRDAAMEGDAPDGMTDADFGADADAEPGLAPEIGAAFARFVDSRMATRSAITAAAMARHQRIRLPYPRQIEAMGEFEETRLLGLQMRGEQQLGLTVFEPTGCGKSTAAAQYKRLMAERAAPGIQPVVHCRLGADGGARDMYVSILAELGDGFSNAGTERTLRVRAMDALEVAGVELVFMDETQHGGRKSGFAGVITSEIKIMLDCGRVPIVLLGTEKAVPIIAADQELSGRLISPCRLGPLRWFDEDDRDLWIGFLAALDARMVADGVVRAPAGLAEEDVADALCAVCGGIIGQLMRVTLMAVRQVTRDGRDRVELADLSDAVDQWSLAHGFATTNHLKSLLR